MAVVQPVKLSSVRLEAGTIWPSKRADKRLSSPGWILHTNTGDRSFTQHVNFAKPFNEPPAVSFASFFTRC